MRFMQRSLMGLFLLALTLGLLALAAGSVRTTLEERWARESVSRPARERVFSVNVVQVTRTDVSPVITTYGEIRSRRTLDLRAPISGTISASPAITATIAFGSAKMLGMMTGPSTPRLIHIAA